MVIERPQRAITLGELLHEYQLGLVLTAGSNDDTTSLPVQWVHVSELEDPAPFLTPETVLLTTGARFSTIRRQIDADGYVTRLIDAGVTALGVAVGLHWDRVPPRVVAACDRLGLPLFRVPYDTSFISIVQASVRLLEARDRQRDHWSLDSQRAVANASLQSNGLSAALRETAARLGRWVCITDRSGRITEFAPESSRDTVSPDMIRREVKRLVDRGLSSGRIGAGEDGLQLFALGKPVLGVLVAADAGTPDPAERSLLGLVAALASVQMEHRAGADAAHMTLRDSIFELMLAGQLSLANKLADGALIPLPRGNTVVARHPALDELPTGLIEDLNSLEASTPGLFSAAHDAAAIIVAEARHAPALRRLFDLYEAPVGISLRGTQDTLSSLHDQAERALEFALTLETPGSVDYRPELHPGVLQLLDSHPDAKLRAEALLEPLRRHDNNHNDRIEASLWAWLAHHGQTSPAAAELGIHRHTLTARIRTAASLLQTDLDTPDARANLWAALRLVAAD